ncbi:MAG: flagellar biosynthetic protein FliR [Candidatus Brocadiaceae bacterium]|nr:flagellar biosynthetic protein FliR [Candidatus Brocadiaceae bacterium]
MDYLVNLINDAPFFLIVFFRVGGILFFAPVFDNAHIPVVVRVAIAFVTAFLIFPVMHKGISPLPQSLIHYGIILVKEIAIGAVIGFAASLVFTIFTMAGNFISNQIGLDMAVVVDPSSVTGEQQTTISVFFNMIAVLLFLNFNGHHWFVKAIAESFKMIPLGTVGFSTATLTKMLIIFKSVFVAGFKISAPILVVLMMTLIALGFMAKTAQELQIFVLAFPIKIMIGMVLLIVTFSYILKIMKMHLSTIENNIVSLLLTM